MPNQNQSHLAYILNGGENRISVLNLHSFNIDKKIKLDLDSTIFAQQINFSNQQNFISIALPHYDFSLGHKTLHNLKPKGGIGILDPKDLKILKKIPTEQVNFNALIDESTKEIYTAAFSHSAKIYVFNLVTGELTNSIGANPDPANIYISDKYILVAGEESSFLSVYDKVSKKLVNQVKIDPYPTHIYPGFDNNTIFIENKNIKSLNIVDLNTLKVIDNIDLDFPTGYAAFQAENKEIWICSPMTNKVVIYTKNGDKWTKKQTINTDTEPVAIAFYKNLAIIVNQKSGTAQIVDSKTYNIIKTLKTGLKPNSLAIRK